MLSKVIRTVGYVLAAMLLCGLAYIYIPRSYDVLPHEQLAGTAYWQLSTGSRIGYVHLEPEEITREFPIVYLHGGPGGAITDRVVQSLTQFAEAGFEVYAYDQVGSGSSARLDQIRDYTVERHVEDLHQIVSQLPSGKVILLGQSWGSVLATHYAVEYPTTVHKIVMTGPGPIFPLDETLVNVPPPDSLNILPPTYTNAEGNRQAYTSRESCIRWFAIVHARKLVSDQQADAFFAKLNALLNRSAVYDINKLPEITTAGGGYYAHLMTMKSLWKVDDPRSRMSELSIPIMILKGQYDNQKWGYAQEYTNVLPNVSLYIVQGAGHFIDVDQPAEYRHRILQFLSSDGE